MAESCSPAVERVLAEARELARDRGLPRATATELLTALLRDPDGWASGLMRSHGWDGTLPTTDTAISAEDVLRAAHGDRVATDLLTSTELLLALLIRVVPIRESLIARGVDWPRLHEQIRPVDPGPIELLQPIQLTDPFDMASTARALDAATNRAREALRVVEDYCRFALDDRFLTEQLKQIRHGLAEALGSIPGTELLASRDTIGDVGTTIGTATEARREHPRHVAQANLKRLQEALRSLEEFGKLRDSVMAAHVEQLRYRSYTLERAILRGTDAREKLRDVNLYVLLTASRCRASLDWTIQEAAAGGAGVFQLREKDLSDRELIVRATEVRRWTREAGVLFIMNDRPDVARLCEADGVHLGQDDMSVRDARKIVGSEAIIGVSTHDREQLRQAILDGADYVGVGPTFKSSTKTFEELAGLAYVREATAETTVPTFAIGGITPENVRDVYAAGATRVAIGAAITLAEDPRIAALSVIPST